MMKWGRKKPVSSSTSASSGLSRAPPVSWFSKFNASSDSKPAKEKNKKKKDEETSKNIPAKSSIKRRNDIQERRNNEENAAATTRKKSDEKFEEIMSSVRKKVRDFQIDTRSSFLEVDKGTVIMTPRSRDKQRCERRDQKLLEQKRKSSRRDASTVLGQTVTKPEHQWQKLKETKLREVKVKADQQRKSLYIRRELNRIGTKENNSKVRVFSLNNSKVRVFSPRATEKCRVKAIEDLKKAAKARAREDGDGGGGGTENESFAVVKCSSDPQKDFRDSMIEMIMENGINHPEELKELLVCYLRLNTDEYHDMIIKVFLQVHNDMNFHYFGVE